MTIKLKKLREERGLSQKEIAKKIGVSRETISAYETGRAKPSLDVALKLAKILKVSVEELFN